MTHNDLRNSLRKAGFRATRPRLLLLSFLKNVKYPLTIQEIVRGVGRTHIDQVTAYRTLEAFKKAGLVTQVDFQHGHAHYEFKNEKRDHHHLVCINCERVEDFFGCGIETLTRTVLKKTRTFAEVKNHSLELFGLCKVCAQ